MNNIGLRIKELREKNNLGQVEFSEIIGVKQPNLSHIEKYSSKISVDIIISIISNFDIDACYLLTGVASNFGKNHDKIRQLEEKINELNDKIVQLYEEKNTLQSKIIDLLENNSIDGNSSINQVYNLGKEKRK